MSCKKTSNRVAPYKWAFAWKNSYLHILSTSCACWVPGAPVPILSHCWWTLRIHVNRTNCPFPLVSFLWGSLEFISASEPQQGQPSLFCQVSLMYRHRKQQSLEFLKVFLKRCQVFFCLLSILSTDELCLLELSDKKPWTDLKKSHFTPFLHKLAL